MTATAEPPLRPVEAPSETVLDRADGVELLGEVHGSGYKDGAALVRRADGQMVQLGPLMYAVLECADGQRTNAALADCLTEQLGRRFDEQHVARLAEKLAEQGLLAGTEHKAPPRRNPLLALRWRVLVTNPKVTKRLTTPFTFLFRPYIVVPVVAAFVLVCWWVLFRKGVAAATSDAFHKPELLLLVVALAIGSAAFHELGHASACRYGGATPAGMGMGIYMVWPAFYTDVTDSYRLPRRDRLRVDLGGLYFNAIVAVVTMGFWLAWHVDALLLLIALQLLEMVKNLSPVIRSDGYHILADATGIPDLYFHIGPTLRRLLPWRRQEPSALTGKARLLVTAWVLIIVPVLSSMMLGAILLLPPLAASTWDSGRTLGAAVPHEVAHGHVLALLTSLLRLFALALPVIGSVLITQKVVRMLASKGWTWSAGSAGRRVAFVAAAAALCAGAAYAWWPAGQYQPVRADQRGTITSFGAWIAAPQQAARPLPAAPPPVHLTPGTHLAVSMIPVGGATKEHPAMFVIAGEDGQPAVAILSGTTPTTTPSTTTDTTSPTTVTNTTTAASGTSAPTVQATAFAFKLPSKPGPGDSQALSVNTTNGAVKYNVAYSLVTVRDGAPVTNKNSAFAFANCSGCTTVAVSFQIVLIVGQSDRIAPINAAGALNVNCPACMTTAIADQIVVTLRSLPSQDLVQKLQDALKQLDAISTLGANGTPAAVAAVVAKVQKQIDTELADSGLLANPPPTTTAATTTTRTATTPTTTAASTTAPAATAPTTTSPSTTSSSTTTATRPTTTATTTTTPAATTTAATTGTTTAP